MNAQSKPVCDIIIPVWNQPAATAECLEAIAANTLYPYRIIVVDNGSGEETVSMLNAFQKAHPGDVTVIRNGENLGFVKAVNQGMKAADGGYVCIMNNDTIPARGWLSALVDFRDRHNDAGLLNPLCNGHAPRNMTPNEYADFVSADKEAYMEMNQCQGFCMLVPREVIDIVGYMDEAFGIGGFDDTDYSMRAHLAGFRSVSVHSAYVFHSEHKSFDAMGDRKKIQARAEKTYFDKWPRHLRVFQSFRVRAKTTDAEIKCFLGAAYALAREWCWVNLWIFGGKDASGRVDAVRKAEGFPVHQNLKFNYPGSRFMGVHALVRIVERCFGRKARKMYDVAVFEEKEYPVLAGAAAARKGCAVLRADYAKNNEARLKGAAAAIREKERKGKSVEQ